MPKKPATTPVALRYPPQYILSYMANRYAIEREEGFILVHFGLLNRSSLLLNRLTCVFTEHTLKLQRENLVQYSDKIGMPKKKIPAWIPPPLTSAHDFLPIVDFIHVSNWEDAHAEICFWNYSQGHMADLVQSGNKEQLTPWGVAMFRCGIDLQRAFLAELYEDAE